MVFAGGLFTAADAQEIVSTGADANETVQIMKSGLIGIAIGLLVLTIFFWIHTDPSRRARAVQRKEQRRGAAAAKKARQTVEGTNPDAGSAAAVSHPDFSRPQASADDAGLSGVFSEREVS